MVEMNDALRADTQSDTALPRLNAAELLAESEGIGGGSGSEAADRVVPGATVDDDGSIDFATMEQLAAAYIPDTDGSDRRSQRENFLDDAYYLSENPDTAAQAGATFEQIERLLTADSAKVTDEQRQELAQQILDHAAHPDGINQGYHNTCVLSDIENILFTENPADAARIIADVALTGSTTIGDDNVSIPAPNLIPDIEAGYNPAAPGGRDFASQLFQAAVANHIGQQEETPRSFATIGSEFDKEKPKTFDFWTDADGNPLPHPKHEGRLARFHGLTDDKFIPELEQLTEKEGALLKFRRNSEEGSTTFSSESEFRDALKAIGEKDGFPVMLVVTSKDSMLDGEDEEGEKRRMNHVLVIRDYDVENDLVSVDNTWGPDRDYIVPTADIYKATRRKLS